MEIKLVYDIIKLLYNEQPFKLENVFFINLNYVHILLIESS